MNTLLHLMREREYSPRIIRATKQMIEQCELETICIEKFILENEPNEEELMMQLVDHANKFILSTAKK